MRPFHFYNLNDRLEVTKQPSKRQVGLFLIEIC